MAGRARTRATPPPTWCASPPLRRPHHLGCPPADTTASAKGVHAALCTPSGIMAAWRGVVGSAWRWSPRLLPSLRPVTSCRGPFADRALYSRLLQLQRDGPLTRRPRSGATSAVPARATATVSTARAVAQVSLAEQLALQSQACPGCGAPLQTADERLPGYVPASLLAVRADAALQRETDPADGSAAANVSTHAPDRFGPGGELRLSVGEYVRLYAGHDLSSLSADLSAVRATNRGTQRADNRRTRSIVCKRCFWMRHYRRLLPVQMDDQDARRVLAKLCDERALIVAVVDIADFPATAISDLRALVGGHNPVLLIGNKVDLLVAGGAHQSLTEQQRVRGWLRRCAADAQIGFGGTGASNVHLVGVHLVSTVSGQGIRELAELIERHRDGRDVFVVGAVNSGKSSVVNALIALRERLSGRARCDAKLREPITPSPMPGTTIKQLTIPLPLLPQRPPTATRASAASTARPDSERPFPSADTTRADESRDPWPTASHGGADAPARQPFSDADQPRLGAEHDREHVLVDTPGLVTAAGELLMRAYTPDELRAVMRERWVMPRVRQLRANDTLFIGGLARIDCLRTKDSAHGNVLLTVHVSHRVALHVTKTAGADDFYARHAGLGLLQPPFGGADRMAAFPRLERVHISSALCDGASAAPARTGSPPTPACPWVPAGEPARMMPRDGGTVAADDPHATAGDISVTGQGLQCSVIDIAVASICGWVSASMPAGQTGTLRVYAPRGTPAVRRATRAVAGIVWSRECAAHRCLRVPQLIPARSAGR